MKRLGIHILLSFALIVITIPTASASVTPGAKCSKAGASQTINGLTFTCKKSGSNLLWSQGVKAQGHDAAFAKAHLLEAQAKATKIVAEAKISAEQISSAPYCVTRNSSAFVSIGGDGSTGLRALIYENPGICDITVSATAAFRCDSPLPPSKNTVLSTGVFPLRAKEKLIVSYNISRYFPQVLLECRLLTGVSSNTVNISPDGNPRVTTLTSSFTGKFNQVEASKKANLFFSNEKKRAEKLIADAKNPAMIAKAWKAAAEKAAAEKAAAEKAAAEKAAAEKLEIVTLGTVCVVGGSCKVGNTGPGGGVVFYDAGSQQPWGRYLEFAPNGWYGSSSDPSVIWCDNNEWPELGPQGKEIGQGKLNTALMLKHCKSGAAIAAASYRGGAKDDWFLPSKEELNELAKYVSRADENDLVVNGGYGRIKIIREDFQSALWSSTDYPGQWGYAYGALYVGQLSSIISKYYKEFVRPIRAF